MSTATICQPQPEADYTPIGYTPIDYTPIDYTPIDYTPIGCHKEIVIPEELIIGVEKAVGFELRSQEQIYFQNSLTSDQLNICLKEQGLPLSGTKQEKSEGLINAGSKPLVVVETLKLVEKASIPFSKPSAHL